MEPLTTTTNIKNMDYSNCSIEQLKDWQASGHNLNSVILLLEKKQAARNQKKHWYIFKEGRNICEFCECLYRFGDTDSICEPK